MASLPPASLVTPASRFPATATVQDLRLGDTQTVFTARETIDEFAALAVASQQPDGRVKRRRQADELRNFGRTLAEPDSAVAKCGRVLRASEAVLLRADGRASWSGIVTCGSVWACAQCAMRIQLERSREMTLLVERAQAVGLSASLVTFTVRHVVGHKLSAMRRGLMSAWSACQRRAAWRNARKRYSVEGTVRAVEVKHGVNGWHPHIHVLMLSKADSAELATMQAEFSSLWRSCVRAKLGPEHEPDDEHGCVVTPAHSADYLTKMGLEVSYSVSKTRGPSRSPFELLADASRGDTRARALFVDYARTMKGQRQLEPSRGLRKRFGLSETADEELAKRITEAESAEPLLALNRREWNGVHQARGVLLLLELAERGASSADLRAVVDRLVSSVEVQRIRLVRPVESVPERWAG